MECSCILREIRKAEEIPLRNVVRKGILDYAIQCLKNVSNQTKELKNIFQRYQEA